MVIGADGNEWQVEGTAWSQDPATAGVVNVWRGNDVLASFMMPTAIMFADQVTPVEGEGDEIGANLAALIEGIGSALEAFSGDVRVSEEAPGVYRITRGSSGYVPLAGGSVNQKLADFYARGERATDD